MLPAIGLAAARQVRVAGRLSIHRAAHLAIRPAIVIPSGIRIAAVLARGYAEAAAKATRKKSATAKTATKEKKAKTEKKPAKKAAKKPAKKPAAKKKPKKELTEEEKTKLKIKELREKALLKEFPRLPEGKWPVYVSARMKEAKRERGGSLTSEEWEFKNLVPQIKKDFDALPAEELEKLEATGEQNKLANQVALKNWVDSHTPWEIHVANRARMVLRRKYNVSARKTIPDPRYPKQPQTPFGIFLKAQHETRDFGDVTFTEAMSQIGAEWKKLTPEERKPYEDISVADRERYEKEMSSIRPSKESA